MCKSNDLPGEQNQEKVVISNLATAPHNIRKPFNRIKNQICRISRNQL